MELATVIGTIVATQKEPRLTGFKILLLELTRPDGSGTGSSVVALDSVGAGEGELVLLVRGSSARLACDLQDFPVDAVILGIVDQVTLRGRTEYLKGAPSEAG